MAVLAGSLLVTVVAVVGGFGLLPSGAPDADAAADSIVPRVHSSHDDAAIDGGSDGGSGGGSGGGGAGKADKSAQRQLSSTTSDREATTRSDATALPTDSGSGRRIVFSEGLQRVWLVDTAGAVKRTYLVSGSLTDNLDPGVYSVYSRSRWAVGVDDSGVMQYFVRFTHGDAGAAIGFHTIPAKDGVPLQTRAQLGTPRSHGCIRQATPDAIALWDFAPIGTKVVVTA